MNGSGQRDSEAERSSWGNPVEFVLSCLNYAIGLGNVWRFPYLCYQNGGGAFLLAYFIMLIVMGTPVFFLELIIGQYSGLGPDLAFSYIAPIFSGLGYCCLVVVFLICVYYMVIVAWTIFYFFASFSLDLGYGRCDHDFNSEGCYSASEEAKCLDHETYYKSICFDSDELCQLYDLEGAFNRTYCRNSNGEAVFINSLFNRTLATAEYFREYVLGIGDATWENFGKMHWELFGCLIFSWAVCYMCVLKGVKTSGKAVYFTVPFPYVILTALVIQGAILEGAVDGIKLFLLPDWKKLLEVDVWAAASSQTFYSFGIGCGSLITLASYNKFSNNCFHDALIVSFANAFTSVYAGFAIFSMLGFLAFKMGVPVEEVARDGPGLAFIAYPEAILLLPASTLWSVIFFGMLFILGLGTQFAGVEAISCCIMDKWNGLRRYESYVTLSICVTCLLLAIPMCFSGGVYIFTLLEWNTASWAIMLIGFAEVVACSWCYGCFRFIDNVRDMTINIRQIGKWYWWICWTIITPLTLVGIFIFQMVHYSPASYEGYEFPIWADVIGLIIGLTTLVPFFIFAVYVLWKREYTGFEFFQPTKKWGPQIYGTDSRSSLTPEKSVN
ncbi:sodium- and chloride-dependent glycine transporter 1-like isoform X2 [Cylas formicarius]|uniref:sodium- and chloride-dependent glycine transporter 1-like isoform X2 n=1 Tax=Cylas formicarius TaxID=197179 RepID=UPI002958C96D|nr:sodium- and chloride-dependent glycine transporter 1-like isoform X2 [Cylas formicarius]